MAIPIGEHNNKKERIGRLRHRVSILTPSATVDAVGGEVQAWSLSATVWANVEVRLIGSDEMLLADRITNETRALITMRYQYLDTESVILWDGKQWEIVTTVPDSHQRWLQIEAVHYKGHGLEVLYDDEGDPLVDPLGNLLYG